jgi:hypothetical protein
MAEGDEVIQEALDRRALVCAPDTLVRTETGAKLHIAVCPHLGPDFREATSSERLAMAVCTWCRAELDGVGRTYCDGLEEAMRVFGTHAGTERAIKEALRFVDHDQIWVPNSRSYVALGRGGRGVAWFGKTYVVPAVGEFLALPDYHAGSGGGSRPEQLTGAPCPSCYLVLPLTGVCDDCA